MACTEEPEDLDLFLSRNPSETGSGRKQVCRMGRTAVFAAAGTVAQEKALEGARNVELHGAAKALSGGKINDHSHSPQQTSLHW